MSKYNEIEFQSHNMLKLNKNDEQVKVLKIVNISK